MARFTQKDYYEVVVGYKSDNEVVMTDVEHEVFMTKLWRACFLQAGHDYSKAKLLVAKALYEVERFASWQVGDFMFFAYNNEVVAE